MLTMKHAQMKHATNVAKQKTLFVESEKHAEKNMVMLSTTFNQSKKKTANSGKKKQFRYLRRKNHQFRI